MTNKPAVRLKFKDAAPVQAKPKSQGATAGTENLVVKCGHSIAFVLYVKDTFRDQRRAKEVTRDCPACRQARVQAEMAAAAERRAKKAAAQAEQAAQFKPRPRLPDGSRFGAVYDAMEEKWTGTLSIEGVTFEDRASGLKKLLYKLDDAYRATIPPQGPST